MKKGGVRGRRGGEARRQEYDCGTPAPLAEDVQVDGRGLPQRVEDLADLLDVQPLLGLPLPAAQHDIIHLLGADSGPLQNTTLGDALDDLEE